jgi:acyl carrier protein
MSVSEQGYVPPQTSTQKVLAEIWAELLEVERISIHDRFVDLGGNSLLAALLISRIHKKFSIELTVGAVFEASTMEEIGTRIDKAQQKS